MQKFVQQSTGIHPRASEVADKLRAFLEANRLSNGVHIRIIKGKKPEKPAYGYDWMSTANDTVLALNLDYHDNALWLNNPGENKLKRFLRKEGLDLLKMDCTRWYVSVPPPVEETMEPADLVNATKKPRFVPYKSIHTGDEGLALKIDWPEAITQAQWAKISRLMNQKGYDSRGAADAQRAVYGFMQRFGRNLIPPVLKDWIDTIALVLDLKAPSQSPDVKTAGATPASKVFRRAIKEWGTTHDPALAGYILPSGAMLDLSGANQGGGTNRAYDHRQVGQFFEEHFENPTDAMHAFMDMGAIRWMPEANGLDLRKPPTGPQLTTIRRMLDHVRGSRVYLDVFWPNYGSAAAEYPENTPAERIVRDIQTFYKTGELKQMSQVQQMHLAAESAVDYLLKRTSGGEWVDDINKVVAKLPPDGTDGFYHEVVNEYPDCMIEFDYIVGEVNVPEWKADRVRMIVRVYFDRKWKAKPPIDIEINLAKSGEEIFYDTEDQVPPEMRQKAIADWTAYYQKYVAPALMKKMKESRLAYITAKVLLENAEQLELPLDSDDGDEGSPLSPEEIGDWLDKIGITKGYRQIDGDYGDPWLYGGTWFSAGIEGDPDKWASIVHFDGLDRLGIEEYDTYSKKVKEEAMKPEWRRMIAQVKAEKYPEDEDDERATDEVLEKIADMMNEQRTYPVYRTNADDPNEESWVTDSLAGMLDSLGLTHEQWMNMGPENRVCAAADYYGWDNFDSDPYHYTKQELSKFLGIEL